MINLPVVDTTVAGKKVLVRGDIDVPVKDGVILDDTRLKDIKPTIDFLLEQNCQVTLCGHLGRPGGKIDPALSSKPVQGYFPSVKVLENLRFDPREEANDGNLARGLVLEMDVFVNESFAESYREVASISGAAKLLPHFAGFRLAKEIEVLSKLLDNPARPLVVVVGGAKLDTKLPVIKQMAKFADVVIVGGELLEEMKDVSGEENVHLLELTKDGKDCTGVSIDKYGAVIAGAATIIWNGPLGTVEDFTYQVGTRRLAELISANSKAYKVLGGGDTVGFVDKLGLTDKFGWVSSGGGSMLKFLAGEKLPGVEALINGS